MGTVDLGSLQDLDLGDGGVLDGVDHFALVAELGGEGLVHAPGHEALDLLGGGLAGDVVVDSLPDGSHLLGSRVRGLALLLIESGSESNDEDSEDVSVGGFDLNHAFDQGLPFVDELVELVSSHAHPVKRCQAVLSVNLVDNQLDFSPAPLSNFWFRLIVNINRNLEW